ncbi:MAG TPA: tripartite tricarboxylate transporter substrate binding protein [Variovorax sp.]
MNRSRFYWASAMALVITAIAPVAHAEDPYPNRPIKMVAPYEPGGGVDIMARMVAQNLGKEIGQSVVVENRAGVGGAIGTRYVATAPPDGYTLLLASTSPVVIAPHLVKNVGYDPEKDLTPVSLIADVPALLVVKPDAPFENLAALIARAKAEPGKYTVSSSGIGGTAHLAMQLLKMMAGVDLLHVPYKGTGPAITAVMGGEVTMTFTDIVSGLKYVQGGQLRALAITGEQRSPQLPNVPTVAETVPGYAAGVWYAVFAPARTPAAIVDSLNAALVRTLKEDLGSTLALQGVQPIGSSPAQLSTYVKQEDARWSEVVKAAGMKPE